MAYRAVDDPAGGILNRSIVDRYVTAICRAQLRHFSFPIPRYIVSEPHL